MKRINKPCPFCFGAPYYYRTANGLIRHVMRFHACDARGRNTFYATSNTSQIRIETSLGYTYVKVSGWDEVEEFLKEYIEGFQNPSKKTRLWKYVQQS